LQDFNRVSKLPSAQHPIDIESKIAFCPSYLSKQALTREVIHVVEAETHVEMLPHTEIMADIAGAHFVHAHNAPNATILVPQPTTDIHDPLVRSVVQNK
jgi:hypothetical protein